MKKVLAGLVAGLALAACSGEAEKETLETVNIPNESLEATIFESEKQAENVDEEEVKASIKTYLDSSETLLNQRYPYEEVLDLGEPLTESEQATFTEINTLLKENDENFALYIDSNTLPENYQEETERISAYVTGFNSYLVELDFLMDDEEELAFADLAVLGNMPEHVNGREQAKIEEFLAEKGIETKLFADMQ